MRSQLSQLSFADLEKQEHLQRNGLLWAVKKLLDQNGELVQQIRGDLEQGLKKPTQGRHGINASQTLCSLVLMRIKDWDYRELRERIDDGMALRCFTGFYSHSVPKHDAFNRAFRRISPKTMRAINEMVIADAVGLGVEDGKTLRVDTTVVETNIHHPTDSTLLWDAVRTLHRLGKQLRHAVPGRLPRFSNRTLSARRRMQEIQRMSASQRATQQLPKYRALIKITQAVVNDARTLLKAVEKAMARRKPTLMHFDGIAVTALSSQIRHYADLADRVIDQTKRRVEAEESVPAEEKLYSIFEPHTDLIKRGKALKPIELGHKVLLAETAQGLITDYRVLQGNPADCTHVEASLERHQQTFSAAPEVYATDRGFYSAENLAACQRAGVAEICIPYRGGAISAEQAQRQRTRTFKQGQRFRAGIEGRISVLFRGRGMKRCRWKGQLRFEVLVAAAVLTNNLLRIAQLLQQSKPLTHSAAVRAKSRVPSAAT
ncbi:MAG: ISNCY family transposase [Bryobacterales bacterium]|nr:ISNCY family transposase [Bryobacterales bacterium]